MPEFPANLRPATSVDTAFLFAVYASTREAELAQINWSAEQKNAFCYQQAQAQANHYRHHYPTAQYFIIESQQQPAGRLYVDHWEKEIRIMDIALLPSFRGKGIGTQLLRSLQNEASEAGKLLSIHVESFNPARRLYERLGFQVAEDKGVYQLMTWSPASLR